jgi:hypothetical protein
VIFDDDALAKSGGKRLLNQPSGNIGTILIVRSESRNAWQTGRERPWRLSMFR